MAAISDACGGDTPAVLAQWERAWAARDVDQQPSPATPRQLPSDVRGFTGRAAELSQLDALLAEPDSVDAVLLTAIAGTAGVGKTALAVHWARRIADRFPDGQLWLNLRGYDPQQPIAPGRALTVLLHALGVPAAGIPLELDAQTGLYRSLLTDRRVLVVLDNASSAEQVRPLLPGSPGCLVVVTSRDDLAGLVARDGATRLRLDALTQEDAVALLRTLLRPLVADPDPAMIERLAMLCSRLPLALRIAADRAGSRGEPALDDLIAEFEAGSRLDALAAGGDPQTAVREVFSWSYHALPARAATLFGRLGLIPGSDWDVYGAAALADCSPAQARGLLATLAGAYLIEQHPGGRFDMHDLLLAYARERAGSDPGAGDALDRLLACYLHTAAVAMDAAFAYETHTRPRISAPDRPGPAIVDPRQGLSWLDTERANLLAMVEHAVANDQPAYAFDVALTLNRYLLHSGHYSDALAVHSLGLQAARALRDDLAEATCLNNLGSVYLLMGRHDEAFENYRQALVRRRELGDRAGEGITLGNLGLVYWRWARYEEAAEHYRQALAITREIGDLSFQAKTLENLGSVYERWGRLRESLEHRRQALAIFRDIGNKAGESTTLANLGDIYELSGQYDLAHDHYRRALDMAREIGDRAGEAATLDDLGRLSVRRQRYDEAERQHDRALTIFRQSGHRAGEATALSGLGLVFSRQGRRDKALESFRRAIDLARELNQRGTEIRARNGLGELMRLSGRVADARTHHLAALRLATELGDRYEQACSLDGLAHVLRDHGEYGAAHAHWQDALAIFTDLGCPEADTVRAAIGAALADRG